MPSKELTNQVAISAGITKKQASAAISTILAALQEQFEGVEKDPFIPQGAKDYIRKFLVASALGEQSE